MVGGVERLHAELQVALSVSAQRDVLKHREILVHDPGVAQIHARVGAGIAESGYHQRRHVDGRAGLGIAVQQKAHLLPGEIAAGRGTQKTGSGIRAGNAESNIGRHSGR